jgi:hypothetical protein
LDNPVGHLRKGKQLGLLKNRPVSVQPDTLHSLAEGRLEKPLLLRAESQPPLAHLTERPLKRHWSIRQGQFPVGMDSDRVVGPFRDFKHKHLPGHGVLLIVLRRGSRGRLPAMAYYNIYAYNSQLDPNRSGFMIEYGYD